MAEGSAEQELELTYTGVHVCRRDHVIVPSIADEFAEDNRDHAFIYHWMEGEWLQHLIDSNTIADVCTIDEPSTTVLNLAIDGEVFVATLPGFDSERIAPRENGPTRACHLKCVRRIGSHVYAAGLARQVYRRDRPKTWERVDVGTFVPSGGRNQAIGFASIDGLSEKSIYAVGYKGEIWYFDGRKWDQLDSPTNLFLSQVRCVSEKDVYVCGMSGTVLRGNKSGFKILKSDSEIGDLWGMSIFNKRVYVAGYDGIFTIKDDVIQSLDLRLPSQPSTAYLDSADGVLWSVGQKDIVNTEDGVTWTTVEKP